MSTQPDSSNGSASVARTLLDTLTQEEDALRDLQQQFAQQLEALRHRRTDALEHATEQTQEVMNRLNQIRQVRERQMRLLGRVLHAQGQSTLPQLVQALQENEGPADVCDALLAARDRLRHQAEQAQQRCEELEFTLNYAIQLGRDMLMTVQGLDVPPPAGVYNATGQSTASTPRSLVNRVG